MRTLALLAASAALVTGCGSLPFVTANANAGSKLYVCATPQNSDLSQAAYEALTWVEVKAIGNHGETGPNTNILTYDTWDTVVIQKAKGTTDAGSPEIEVARIPSDPGQQILRAAAKTNFNYAFKMVRNDKATTNGTPTVLYNRGLVTGPRRPHGRNEDFDLEIFTLALNQLEITVDPNPSGSTGIAPLNTALPTITGTATVGQTLTASTGTWTGDATITYAYQWFASGQAIPGATSATYDLTSNETGDKISVRVVATNAAGYGEVMSAQTAAVA